MPRHSTVTENGFVFFETKHGVDSSSCPPFVKPSIVITMPRSSLPVWGFPRLWCVDWKQRHTSKRFSCFSPNLLCIFKLRQYFWIMKVFILHFYWLFVQSVSPNTNRHFIYTRKSIGSLLQILYSLHLSESPAKEI